ncbi:hypothetical protein HY989_06900 [Candidatus Micrarchaeota archaeon]|nr:hypothetical protein [Candidatus Micrarchaeota archaeon]
MAASKLKDKKNSKKELQNLKKHSIHHAGFEGAINRKYAIPEASHSASEKSLDAFHRHEFEPKIPHPEHPFHPYKKKSIYGRISESFRLHGLPEPKLLLVLLLVIAGSLLAFSVLLPIISGPTKADLLIAIQDQEGNIIKGATLTLIPIGNGAQASSNTWLDGTAPFSELKIGAEFKISAEKGGEKIPLEDSYLKVPAVRRGHELVIVLRSAN